MPHEDSEEKTISYGKMEGWPATPGTQRMIQANRLIMQEGAPEDDDADSSNLQLAQDAQMLYLATAAHDFDLPEEDPGLKTATWEALRAIGPQEVMREGRVYGGGLRKVEPKELDGVGAGRLVELY